MSPKTFTADELEQASTDVRECDALSRDFAESCADMLAYAAQLAREKEARQAKCPHSYLMSIDTHPPEVSCADCGKVI